MKNLVGVWVLLVLHLSLHAQVDTSFIYKTGMPYGTLDLRISKSATRYYYLQENRTISFRESSPGVKTNTYRDMTSWDSSPYGQGNMREKNGSYDYFIMNYRLLPPVNYNPGYSPGYPLIVFIHGAGERGNCWLNGCYHDDASWSPNTNSPPAPTAADSKLMNNDHNLLHGGSTHLGVRNAAGAKLPNDPTLSTRSFPGFVLFPQALNTWNSTSVQDAIRLVRLIAKKYNIDENRIYIEGLSAGGYGVYEAIKRAPWLFASAITMSAVNDGGITSSNYQEKVAHIPMWTFQGGVDTDPTKGETERYVKRFRDAGAIVKYTLYPELGHGTWNTAMRENEYFKWMLNQNKANIHTFAGSTAICMTNGQGVRMYLSEGFRAYQWERNGVIISGANAASYVATTTGTYRARFSRKANPGTNDWNQWSAPITVTQNSPAQPVLSQIGTAHLKDLNNYGDAKLIAPKGFAKYYWYKDGVQIALSDTLTRPIFKPGDCSTGTCAGNGAYTLKTSQFDNCPSPASKTINIYFNNQSPVNITAPTNFTGSLTSASSVKLTWSDASTNEAGFEIWRRRLISGTTYTKWEMRTITNPNIATFTDTGLEPSSTFNYKIRAVSNGGKSNYTPATTNLVITSGADTQLPTAPQNLTASQVAINTIQLKWSASSDNSGIKRYRVYYGSQSVITPDNKTTFNVTGLSLNTVYEFTVKAEDLGGNLSASSNVATANTYVNGLFYEHSTGSWKDLDEIDWVAPAEFTGKVTTFTLTPRTQEDYFNFEFDGYLYINTPGTYTFQTVSSDGSRLALDDVVLVDNDGIHGSRTITSAAVTLAAGPKRINVKYFEADESNTLTVRYRGPDTNNSYVTIPSSALKSGDQPTSTIMASEQPVARMASAETATVYPNPTTASDINIQMDSDETAPVQVKLIDFTGREVYNGVFNADEINYGVKITPSEIIHDGVYLMLINQNGNVSQRRISIKN